MGKNFAVNFGIIAVIPPSEKVVHFSGYKQKPEKEQFFALFHEFSTKEGLFRPGKEKLKDVVLKLASAEQVELYKKQIEG